MTKKMVKNLMLVLTMVMLCFAVGMTASALEPTGQCGDNVYWNFDESTGELVISGEGEMWDYEYYESPFFSIVDVIKSVIIENGVTSIGNEAFDACDSITSINISDSVTTIGNFALASCGFTSITIPDSVTTIGDCAFSWCLSLTDITIPASVDNIGNLAFYFCQRLKSIKVDENNKNYSNDNYGVLFNKDKSTLIQYPFGNMNTTYNIPDSVTNISAGAFYDDVNFLTNITIPENVTLIDSAAFFNMQFLDKMVVRSMNATLGEYSLCANEFSISGISREDFMDLYAEYLNATDGSIEEDSILEELNKYISSADGLVFIGTIYCHAGSTAETYAIENGIDYVLTHFYEDEWTYDYNKMIRYHKCIHCDEYDSDFEAIELEAPVDTEGNEDFFSKIIAWFKSLIDLIMSWFNK